VAKWLGRLGFGAILLALPAGAAAEDLMVRGTAPKLAGAIADASLRSATFRRLVEAVAAAGGLVYVHHGTCGRNVRACLVLNIRTAGPFRVLSIRVDKRRKGRDLMVAIGHELRHVLEVLNEPSAVDADSIRIFYERTAPTARLSFETQAAIETELKIDGELRAYAGAIR
jgi:hypothetical protein